MPTYAYKCTTCETEFDRILPISRYAEPQTCDCGSPANKQVTSVNFTLPGDGWASKNGRVESQMRRRSQGASKRQEEMRREAPGVRLVPNVEGERVGSWSDAKKLAESKGKDTSSYEPMVRKERTDKA